LHCDRPAYVTFFPRGLLKRKASWVTLVGVCAQSGGRIVTRILRSSVFAGALVLAGATPAFAYVGPGAGVTLLGALGGLAVVVVLAIGSILLWPLRALMRRRRDATPAQGPDHGPSVVHHQADVQSTVNR
jgi:hypothetical protein